MSGEAPGLIEKLYISRIGLFMSCLSASKYLKSQRCAMVKSFFFLVYAIPYMEVS
jgi:hypothetical protein